MIARATNPGRRGSAILAVLLLLVIGVVIAATVLVAADAAGESAESERHRAQARAMAWSGVQAVMAELSEQREDLLDGLDPQLTQEWSLFTLDDGTRGIVRLLDLDPQSDAMVVAENAKLDINAATAEMLAAVPGLDGMLAARIVEARDTQPFSSVAELLRVEGITPDLLYGPPDVGWDGAGGDSVGSPDLSPASPLGVGMDGPSGLVSYLTVFAFDPNVQVGFQSSQEHRGKLRVNLDQEWSDDLERAITERFGAEAAQAVKQLMDGGQTFATDSELAGVLIDVGFGVEGWGELFDVFTTTDDEFLAGRVDVNRAGPEVLACVPGISPEQAAAIVDRRETLDAPSRAMPTWLLQEGLIEPEDYKAAADWITARSMQWRVRLEVGVMAGDGTGGFDESAPMTMDDLMAGWDEAPDGDRLQHRMVVEAVIDVASSRPRVAYLREVTLLDPVLAMLHAEAALDEDAERFGPEPGGFDESVAGAIGDGFGEAPDDGLDFGGGFDLAPPQSGFDQQPAGDLAGTNGDMEPTDDPAEQAGDSGGAVDRRIGRWTTRKAGGS
ncbi:MAG: helix-hairpin-helix domain-containing protein [Planctomycetota bacterium]|nr:helix-hairpin-helix domain-containing protein [Planctomycetota bacterium]